MQKWHGINEYDRTVAKCFTEAKGESENMEYAHMKCNCGGIIGMRDKENFSCDKCGKVYRIGSGYDVLMTNEKAGWIFPMIKKE